MEKQGYTFKKIEGSQEGPIVDYSYTGVKIILMAPKDRSKSAKNIELQTIGMKPFTVQLAITKSNNAMMDMAFMTGTNKCKLTARRWWRIKETVPTRS